MYDLEIIINSLGEQNEEIDEDILNNIEDEINSINDEKAYFILAKISIQLGKPQILDYLVKEFGFKQNEIGFLYEEIKKYKKNQEKNLEDSDDEEDLQEIMQEFAKIIKNCIKLPYKKNNY